jgi:hypothetical protein
VTGGRQAGDVGHLAAGDEPDGAAARQAQQLAHPAGRDRLGDREGRRRDGAAGVLVPGRDQPIGGDGDGQRAADDEAEVAWAGGGRQAGLGVGGKVRDDGARVLAGVGQGALQPRAQILQGDGRAHGPLGEAVEELVGEPGGIVEHVVARVHVTEA